MASNDIEKKRRDRNLSAYMERVRSEPSIRNKLDISFRIKGHSVEVFEIRPSYQAPEEKIEIPVAKATQPLLLNRSRIL